MDDCRVLDIEKFGRLELAVARVVGKLAAVEGPAVFLLRMVEVSPPLKSSCPCSFICPNSTESRAVGDSGKAPATVTRLPRRHSLNVSVRVPSHETARVGEARLSVLDNSGWDID